MRQAYGSADGLRIIRNPRALHLKRSAAAKAAWLKRKKAARAWPLVRSR